MNARVNIGVHDNSRSYVTGGNISIKNNVSESDEIKYESLSTTNIISILRSSLNNENVSREKTLNQVYNLINKRLPIKYSSVQKRAKSKDAASNKEKVHGKQYNDKLKSQNKDLDKIHAKNMGGESKISDKDKNKTMESNSVSPASKSITSPKLSAMDENGTSRKHVNILFDYILSTLIISDQIDVKLDILTLLEEQYEIILGGPEQILTDKRCWDRYNTTFNLFEHIIAANYKEIAKESINLFEASTVLSGSNSISIENIHQALINNSKYSISVCLQSQTLVAFTSIAVSLNLLEIAPFWFSKLISILFIICKDDCVRIQKLQDRDPILIQNYYSNIRKYAIECLIEINRNYPLIFCSIMDINQVMVEESENANVRKQGFGFIQANIHPSIWPDNLEKGFISDFKNVNRSCPYKDQFVDLIINIIVALIVDRHRERVNVTKFIKEKEKFLTYLMTYIMENLKSVSCWSLHHRILFLKKITKTLSIPSNILEPSILPFSYSSRVHILFEVCLYIMDEVSKESFSNVYHQIVGILNNFRFPLSFRKYSSFWIQFLISNYSEQFINQSDNRQTNSLAGLIHNLLIPKWYDFCCIKYFKSLIIFQLSIKSAAQNSGSEDFFEAIYESLNSLQEYIVIKAPVGAHSTYLKLIFKIAVIFGINQFISDLIIKYTCHSNFQISSDHINNSIQLLHFISVYSENSENYEHILQLFKTFLNHINTLNSPRDIDPFLMVLIYLSQRSRLLTGMGNNTVISDLVNSLFYISKVFLQNINQSVLRWIYINKIFTVCLSIATNNENNYSVIHMLNGLFGFIKSQLRVYDTQLLDSLSEIEYSVNYMSSKTINSLFEARYFSEVEQSWKDVGPIPEQSNLEICQRESDGTSINRISLDATKRFRRQMYGLRDDSFSVFSKRVEDGTLILPFQIRYLEVDGTGTCLYGIKLSFKSSNDSLEIDPVYIPFLRSQNIQEFESEDFDEKVIEKYLGERSSKVISSNMSQFLLLVAKVKFPIPGKLQIYLEFNDELGQIFYDKLEDIQVTFQDYFHPSPSENWILRCHNALSQGQVDSLSLDQENKLVPPEMVSTCKLLDIPSNIVTRNINRHLRIFEVDGAKLLSFIDNKFSIDEDFDFKHDLLINQGDSKRKSLAECNQIQVNYRWFCIHLPPKYYLIIQFSTTNKLSIVRIHTDFPQILSHCDNFFDDWTSTPTS